MRADWAGAQQISCGISRPRAVAMLRSRAFRRGQQASAFTVMEAKSTMQRYVATLTMFGLLAAPAAASAQMQEWTERGYANLSLGFQGSAGNLEDAREFSLYQEQARISVDGDTDAGPFFDIGGGARVWRNVSVGASFHRVSGDGDASVQGSIPHPVFFDRPRSFTAEVRGLQRSERALHISVGYMWIVNERVDVHVLGGPSFFHVSQEVVGDVAVAESGPPFTSVVASPAVATREESPVGAHIGADVTYRFYQQGQITVGAGAFLRYAGASADILLLANDVSTDIGGVQFGFGLRTRF